MAQPVDYKFDEEGLCTVRLVKPHVALLESYLDDGKYKLREYGCMGGSLPLVPHVETFNFRRWLATINQDEDDTLVKIREVVNGMELLFPAARECKNILGLAESRRGDWRTGGSSLTWVILDDDYLIYHYRPADVPQVFGQIECAYLTDSDFFYKPILELNTETDLYYPARRSEFLYGRHVGASYFCYLNECNAERKPPIIEDTGESWDGSEIDPVKLLFWDDGTEDYSATLNLSNGIH